ncbi:HAD family hydrolase [Natrialbaceae archaeon GCM10025810]|uniref:HAD family hydrolase n=1 Tax=Halovalidus salilacus TaxID=3075124 RepID=UPI003609C93E
MRYDAVVFDNDGVLTTPTDRDVLAEAIRSALESVGADSPAEGDVRTLFGPTVTCLREIADAHGVDPESLWRARERAAIDAQREELRTGRKRSYDDVDALEALSESVPIGLGIVSNNQHETIRNVLEHADLPVEFEVWYGREPTLAGIERKKPSPHYLERAIEDLGAQEPLFVGDNVVDVRAADAAGVDSAYLRRADEGAADPTDPADLEIDPTHVIGSLRSIPELL